MKRISNYQQAKKVANKVKSYKAKLRAYHKVLPTVFGKLLLSKTEIPMFNKNGKPVTYKTQQGMKQRFRTVKSWKELNKYFSIVPTEKYRELQNRLNR